MWGLGIHFLLLWSSVEASQIVKIRDPKERGLLKLVLGNIYSIFYSKFCNLDSFLFNINFL
jgi:hypothetical protein